MISNVSIYACLFYWIFLSSSFFVYKIIAVLILLDFFLSHYVLSFRCRHLILHMTVRLTVDFNTISVLKVGSPDN